MRGALGRNHRLAGMFIALAAVTAALAVAGPLPLTVLLWPAMSWLLVGASYLGRGSPLVGKSDGRLDGYSKLLLAPHLALLYATWHASRLVSREPPFARLTEQIVIGRRLLMHEYPPLATLVDLTAELDEHIPPGVAYVSIPILDAAPLEPEDLRDAARRVAAAAARVYGHCAQGHGRTAMVAAATLLETGVAASLAEALEVIRRVRPWARPNALQARALAAAFP